jgi:hypothetical protein
VTTKPYFVLEACLSALYSGPNTEVLKFDVFGEVSIHMSRHEIWAVLAVITHCTTPSIPSTLTKSGSQKPLEQKHAGHIHAAHPVNSAAVPIGFSHFLDLALVS